jgi:hypothetical protein
MTQVDLHEGQSEIIQDMFIDQTCRFAAVKASRGWGKSYAAGAAAVTALYELFELDENVPNKNVYIIAPTYDQVTDIYYPILAYDFGLEAIAARSRRDIGRFEFPGNVELRLVSYEAVERLRGKGAYMVIGDEISSWKKGITPREAWEDIIQPCIITRWSPERAARFGAKSPGRALMISTPKGYNFFYDMYQYEHSDERWKSYSYDYRESPYLDPVEIEKIKHQIDPIAWNSEYEARFEDSGNNVFYCFSRKIHVRKDVPEFTKVDKDLGTVAEDVHAFIDFNVGIQATSFAAIRGTQIHVIDETKGHPDTENLAAYIKDKYLDKGHKVYVYPDPTGKARKSSAPVGQTDFSILKNAGLILRARTGSPPIVDSVAAVNKKLLTAAGDIDFFVHPRCMGTIKSLERTIWLDKNPDSATIDKKEGVEHFSDGVRYGTEFLFPIRTSTTRTKRGFNF